MAIKQFPNEFFLISLWRAGAEWAGCSGVAIPCPDGRHLTVERGGLAGPLPEEQHVLAELQALAKSRGYCPAEIVVERYQPA